MKNRREIRENGSQPAIDAVQPVVGKVPDIPAVPPIPAPAVPTLAQSLVQIPDFEAMAGQFQAEWSGLISPLMSFLNHHQRMRTMEPFHLGEAIRNLQLCATLGKEARIQFLATQQRNLVQLIQQQGQQAVPAASPMAPEGKA